LRLSPPCHPIPQLVNLQLSVHKREQQLEAKAREVSDAS
jgi:hypothetical protein